LSSLVFKQIKRDDSGCVTYLIVSSKTKDCAIVDPLLDLDFIIQGIKNAGFSKVTHVIDTHTHADHVSGARNLVKMFGLNGVIMHSSSKCNFKTKIKRRVLQIHDRRLAPKPPDYQNIIRLNRGEISIN